VRKRAEDFSKAKDASKLIPDFLREVVAPDFPSTEHGQWILSIFAENTHTLSTAAIARIHMARGACDMSGRLKDLRVPTMVINGAHDNSLAGGTETAAGVKGSRHVVLPGTGHACCIEDPKAFNGAVIDFFKQHALWTGTTIPAPGRG
jgi:3-oxoadipate enol-lactonase